MEENKRKAIILTFIGVLTLLFVVVGGTFAYFQIVNTDKGETNTNFETATDDLNKYGTPILEKGSDLFINLSASDMAYSKKGLSYWAVNDVDKELNHKDDRSNYVISTARIQDPNSEGSVSDAYLKCTSELTITVGGTKASLLKAGDGKLYLGVASETEGNKGSITPESYDLYDLVQEQGEEGKKVTVNYTIVGFTSANVIADVEIVNRDDDQNYLAGDNTNEESEITITINNTNLSCSVSEKPVYAKVDNTILDIEGDELEFGEMYKSQEYYDKIEKISFVDYVPSEEELSSLTYWDLSDTASGTSENSVIGWIEKSDNKGYSWDTRNEEFSNNKVDLYNLYIGSKDKIYIKNLSNVFDSLVNLIEVKFDNLSTSETTDMSGMFWLYKGTSLDLSNFDTSQVTNMSKMFSRLTADLPFKDWPNFVTTNVRNMSYMFSGYQGTALDLSTFDTSSVNDMSGMFQNLSVNLPFKDWPNFVTTNVRNMSYMFSGYQGTALDLSTFDISQVTDMSSMFHANVFSGSGSLIKITFSDKYSTPKLINTSWMFNDQKILKEINFGNFTFDNVTNVYGTFSGVPSSCQVKINKSQGEIFESKFPLNGKSVQGGREFTPTYVN